MTKTQQQILQSLIKTGTWMDYDELERDTALKRPSIRRAMGELLKRGQVERTDAGYNKGVGYRFRDTPPVPEIVEREKVVKYPVKVVKEVCKTIEVPAPYKTEKQTTVQTIFLSGAACGESDADTLKKWDALVKRYIRVKQARKNALEASREALTAIL